MGTLQIKSRRDGIEVCVEKVGVDPQRHAGVFVPEHPRQCQHVDPGTDRQAGAAVPQIVRRNRLYPGSFDSPPEPSIGRLRPRGIVDRAHTANLADVGAAGYDAAVIVDHNGDCHLALVLRSAVGNLSTVYDQGCSDVAHDQLGPLPPYYAERIAE
jgi:hypothetical protein